MTQTLQDLVSRMLPAWIISDAPSRHREPSEQRMRPAPNTEAEAAAWLMRRERQEQTSN